MKVLKVTVLVAMLLIISSPFAFAYDLEQKEPHLATKILDLVIVRPLSIVVSTASTGLYLGTSPITYTIGVSEPAARILVEAPWRFTNARYLGEFDHYKDERPMMPVGADEKEWAKWATEGARGAEVARAPAEAAVAPAEAAVAPAEDTAAKIDALSTKMDRLEDKLDAAVEQASDAAARSEAAAEKAEKIFLKVLKK